MRDDRTLAQIAQEEQWTFELYAYKKVRGPLGHFALELAFVLYPLVLSAMARKGLWVPAVIVVSLFLVKHNLNWNLIALVWALASRAWLPAGIIALQLLLLQLSILSSLGYARTVIRDRRPTISAFRAGVVLFSLPASFAASLAFAGVPWLSSGWLIILGVAAGLLLGVRFLFVACRLWPPWRRLHYSMMIAYAEQMAVAVNEAEASERPVLVDEVLYRLLCYTYGGNIPPREPWDGFRADESTLRSVVARAHDTAQRQVERMGWAGSNEKDTFKWLLPRAVIREVVADDWGEEEADRYWEAVRTGKAR